MSKEDSTASTSDEYPASRVLESIPADISVMPAPHTASGLTVYPLEGQSIQGKVEISPRTVGVVVGGLDDYLESRRIDTHEIPSTYSNWDAEFATDSHGREESPVFEGPVGEARDGDEARQFCFKSEYVRAGVRILTGGGRFKQDEFTFHEAIPFAILEHPTASIVIAPLDKVLEEASEPDFTYTAEEASDNFKLVE